MHTILIQTGPTKEVKSGSVRVCGTIETNGTMRVVRITFDGEDINESKTGNC